MTTTKSIKINEDLKIQIEAIQESLNISSASKVIELLVNSYNSGIKNVDKITLDDDEQSLIEQATQYESYDNLLKSGLIWACKKTITQQKTLEDIDLDSDKTKKSTSKGLGRIRVLAAIEKIHNHNNSCQDISDKWCITKGTIFKATGSNKQTIANLVDHDHEIKTKIEEYNGIHGLTEGHNRKGKGIDFPVIM